MKKLITGMTLIVLVSLLANSALASGPFKLKDQMLVSLPMWGDEFSCTVINVSDRVIDVRIEAFGASITAQLSPMGMEALVSNAPGNPSSAVCTVEWFGNAKDIRGTICSENTPDGTLNFGVPGCVEAF